MSALMPTTAVEDLALIKRLLREAACVITKAQEQLRVVENETDQLRQPSERTESKRPP
jgi:hypothetical protein